MSTSVDQTTRDTVSKFVADGFMFTSFDVTVAVRRALGKGMFVSHHDVKNVVEGMYNDGDMQQHVRNVINVGANVEPWLYYHPTCDVTDYDPHWINNNPNQTNMKADVSSVPASTGYTPPSLDLDDEEDADEAEADVDTTPSCSTSAATTQTPVSSVRLGKNEHRLTVEGRLHIPINITRQAGLYPYQQVSLIRSKDKITIHPYAIPSSHQKIVKVNKDGRIRIGYWDLKYIAVAPKSTTFKVELDNSDIVIQTV